MTVGDGEWWPRGCSSVPSSVNEPFGGEDERTWFWVAPPEEGRESQQPQATTGNHRPLERWWSELSLGTRGHRFKPPSVSRVY